jgi:MoaA/NifB/PqqE/SkfB family radical SAM enzyme
VGLVQPLSPRPVIQAVRQRHHVHLPRRVGEHLRLPAVHTGNVRTGNVRTGNVRTDDVVTLYREHPVFVGLRDFSAYEGRCGRCQFVHTCGGSEWSHA